MTVPTYMQPNYTTQTGTVYKTNIDAATAVLAEAAAQFAGHEVATPNMTVQVDSGRVRNGLSLTTVAQQTSGVITAPVTNPRIDRVVIDQDTGVISIITGAENASPVAPGIGSNKIHIAAIALATSTTSITNSIITDERITLTHILENIYSNGSAVSIGANDFDGTMHVSSGLAGSVTATAAANLGVFESSASNGVSILTPDNNSGMLAFGSPSDAIGAQVLWNYDLNFFYVGTDKAGASLLLGSGSGITGLTIDPSQGVFGVGATGSGMGSGTGNFVNLFINGDELPRIVSGTISTASLAVGAAENNTITHGLGSDNVYIQGWVRNEADGDEQVSVSCVNTLSQNTVINPGLGAVAFPGGPSSGDIATRTRNNGTNASVCTFKYLVTALT